MSVCQPVDDEFPPRTAAPPTANNGVALPGEAHHGGTMPEKKAQESLHRVRRFFHLEKIPHPIRKVVVGILGGIFLILGIIMIVTPGPAFVFIPLGVVLLVASAKLVGVYQ